MWEIYSKDGGIRGVVGAIEYHGTWMGECYVTIDIESPRPIEFAIGDYIEYRGERFEINYNPTEIKSAPAWIKRDGFKYEQVKFNSLADELTRCEFLDYVKEDNQIHYTGLPSFSFFAPTVQALADRIQVNLDRLYNVEGKRWTVTVQPEYVNKTNVNISISQPTKVWGALELVSKEFGAYFVVRGRTITIGTAGIPTTNIFKYGKGNGLASIKRQAESDQQIVTRLRVYGSKENMPLRYYNNLVDSTGNKVIPNNMAVNFLMLPSFPYETQDPYIDSPNIDALGIREGSVFFDGSNSDLENIRPSIEGMTAEQLLEAQVATTATGALDEVVSAEQCTDDGVWEDLADGEEVPNFTIQVKDLGFNLNDHLSTEDAVISMKSGMLGGREFTILKCEKNASGYLLTCSRVYDDSLQLYFPYNAYNIKPGDKFVLLHIEMPDAYIKAASQRLLKAGQEYLAKNDYSRSSYSPEIDEIFMAKQHATAMASNGRIVSLHDTIKEGDLMLFEDADLLIENASVVIDTLQIKEGEGAVPTYTVTLRNEKSVGSIQRIQNQIDSIVSGGGQGGGYTATQIRNMVFAYGKEKFLSKVEPDKAQRVIAFLDGVKVGNYVEGVSGAAFDAEGNVEAKSAVIREAIKAESATFEQVGSKDFSDGLTGNGYRIDKVGQDWRLTLDRLTVRKAMTVFEMLVEKVRAVGGRVIVSAANGIVDTVTETGDSYILTFKGSGSGVTHTFQLGDLVRCQMYNGTPKYYWVEVIGVSNDSITVAKSDFNGVVPAEGDELVLMGNVIDSRRQGCISISASEGGKPCIEVFDGISTTSTDRCLKARLGDLSGITSDSLPLDRQPNGYGLFSDNVYLKGAFVLANGTDVATLFEVMNGKLTSQITGLRDYGNLLQNACFDSDLTEWHYEDSIKPVIASNLWLTTGGNFVTVKDTFARIAEDTSLTTPRKVLRIRNSFVTQSDGKMLQQPPRYEVNAAGLRQAHSHSLTFCYKVTKPGRLTVEFKGASKDGYADFDMLGVDTELGVTEGYLTFEALGLWNGTGDFHMAFTGEIYIHSLRLTPDRAADVGNKLQTRINQTAESIELQARQLGEANGRIDQAESKIELMPTGILSTVRQEMIDLEGGITEAYQTQIQLTADSIKQSVSDGLKTTGIDITNGTIVISSDNVHFIDNAGQQQMLLKDGKLNTKVLSTDRLEVVANGKKAVTITPEDEGMKVYDKATGNVCQEFSGMSASNGIGQFFDEENSGVLSLINTSGSATPPPNSDDCNQSVEVSLSSGAKYVASPSYITLTDGMLYTEATAGTIYVDAPYKDYMSINIGTDRRLDDISLGEEATTMAEISIIARCFTDAQCGTRIGGDITIATIKAEATAAYQTTERRDTATVRHVFSCDITDRKNLYCATMGCRIPSAGFIRLYLVHHFITPRLPNYASWGTPRSAKAMWGTKVGVGVKPLAAEYSSEGFISRYFANGFCLASRNDDYVLAYKGDRGMHFESRNANYGLRCTPDGLQTLVCSSPTESRWMPLPVLLFHGNISCIGGTYSVSDTDCVCFDSEMPTLSRLGAGYVRVWFPSSWKTRLGDRLNPDRLSLNVVAQNSTQAIAACVGNIGADSFTIRMSADSSFFVELKLL